MQNFALTGRITGKFCISSHKLTPNQPFAQLFCMIYINPKPACDDESRQVVHGKDMQALMMERIAMVNRRKKTVSKERVRELVTVAFAEDMDLAKQYKKMLNDNEIPAAIKSGPDATSNFSGIAVMVPEDYLDEAHIMLEEQGSNDSFYDLAFQEDDYDEADEDSFGENF